MLSQKPKLLTNPMKTMLKKHVLALDPASRLAFLIHLAMVFAVVMVMVHTLLKLMEKWLDQVVILHLLIQLTFASKQEDAKTLRFQYLSKGVKHAKMLQISVSATFLRRNPIAQPRAMHAMHMSVQTLCFRGFFSIGSSRVANWQAYLLLILLIVALNILTFPLLVVILVCSAIKD